MLIPPLSNLMETRGIERRRISQRRKNLDRKLEENPQRYETYYLYKEFKFCPVKDLPELSIFFITINEHIHISFLVTRAQSYLDSVLMALPI